MSLRTHAVVLLAVAVQAGCSSGPSPATPEERRLHARFQADRDRCREVAERSIAYVDAKDAPAVAQRSQRVEADTQRCMLSRGWNDPRFDGWKQGRL